MEISTSRQKQALVVEDNAMIQKIHSAFLKSFNYGVTAVRTGEEAIIILKSNATFDVILLDINLPQINGYEVSRIIREELKDISTPIMGVSTNTASEIRDKCLSAGINEIYTKPILQETINNFLQTYGAKTNSGPAIQR
ncbi:MAG: response regulator [Gammaproteobacteria bacterium]|nr:response regulator [Gammaproteobacteria bacterium]